MRSDRGPEAGNRRPRSLHTHPTAGGKFSPLLHACCTRAEQGRPDRGPEQESRPFGAGFSLLLQRVGATGFEPATSCSQSTRATKLRHAPRSRLRAGNRSIIRRVRARFANRRHSLYHLSCPSGHCGRSSMVEPLPSKQITRVRFPSSAPIERHSGYKGFRPGREVSGVAFSLVWGGFRGVGAGCVALWRNL